MLEDLTLTIVLIAAAIDSINPCAIGVMLFMSSVLLRVSSRKNLLLKLGAVYITTVFIVYTLSGLGLIWFQYTLINKGFAEIVGVIVGSLIIVLGCIELKDFFWYGKGFSLEITPSNKEKLTKMAEKISFLGIVVIGGFVAIVELPCTGGPYLAITTLLAKSFDKQAFFYLLIYNIIFILPLIIILLMIYFGAATWWLKKWRVENRKWMNLATGLLLIGLGGLFIAHYKFGWYL